MTKKKKSKKKDNFNISKSNKKESDQFSIKGIINSKKSIYTNSTKSIDGKRQHKKSCMYYDTDNCKCKNDNCSKVICDTAHNCTAYKRKEKEKIKKKKLSDYDENFLKIPYLASVHEPDTRYIGLSKNIGTPVHVGFLKSDGLRRHKARCIFYDKINKMCELFFKKCTGSSRCNDYIERDIP